MTNREQMIIALHEENVPAGEIARRMGLSSAYVTSIIANYSVQATGGIEAKRARDAAEVGSLRLARALIRAGMAERPAPAPPRSFEEQLAAVAAARQKSCQRLACGGGIPGDGGIG